MEIKTSKVSEWKEAKPGILHRVAHIHHKSNFWKLEIRAELSSQACSIQMCTVLKWCIFISHVDLLGLIHTTLTSVSGDWIIHTYKYEQGKMHFKIWSVMCSMWLASLITFADLKKKKFHHCVMKSTYFCQKVTIEHRRCCRWVAMQVFVLFFSVRLGWSLYINKLHYMYIKPLYLTVHTGYVQSLLLCTLLIIFNIISTWLLLYECRLFVSIYLFSQLFFM